MGNITDQNLRKLENADTYSEVQLSDIFDATEFARVLSSIIEKNELKIKDIVSFSNISKSYLADIRSFNKSMKPSREKLLDLCLAITADIDEINHLLRLSQYQALDPRGLELDRIILWGLAHNKNNLEIREVLGAHGFVEFLINQ